MTTSLDKLIPSLDKLAKKAKAAGKAVEKRAATAEKTLEAAVQAAKDAGFEGAALVFAKEAEELRNAKKTQLAQRREILLARAKDAGVAVKQYEKTDRVDVFELSYPGISVEVTLGGAKVDTIKESDGERVWLAFSKLRENLKQHVFDRKAFFATVKAAWQSVRRLTADGGEYQLVKDVHRELVLERARRSAKFAKIPEPKNIEPYSLAQFIYDLARFGDGQEGWVCGAERLKSQTPAMRESKDSVHVPVLSHPLAPDSPMARLAVSAA